MPDQSSKINEREKQICERLKSVRESSGWTQTILALAIGIGRDKLANIEAGRTPLRTDEAIRLAGISGRSLRWLATGNGPEKAPLPAPNLIALAPKNALFSKAWDEFFLKVDVPDAPAGSSGTKSVGGATELDYAIEEIGGCFKNLPSIYHANFFAHVHRAASDFFKMNMAGISAAREVEDFNKDNLDKSAAPATLSGMKPEVPTWPELKEDIKKMTAERGAKKALADEIKVSRQVLGNWLSDDAQGAPNAVLTLELLKRVKQWKRKK